MKSNDQALMKFMMEKLGGEQNVMMEFYQRQIDEAAAAGKTLGQLLELAKDAGWLDRLHGFKLTAFAKLILESDADRAQARSRRSSSPAKPQRRTRLSAADKEKLHASILNFLEKNPDSRVGDIAEAVDMESRKVATHLRQLRDAGSVTATGEKASTTYALA